MYIYIYINIYNICMYMYILALARIKFRDFWPDLLFVSIKHRKERKKETILQSHKSDYISLK